MIARAEWPLVVDRPVIGRVLGKLTAENSGEIRFFFPGDRTPEEEAAFDKQALDMAKHDAQLPLSTEGLILLVIPVPL